jgi:hypothetical protein
MDFEFLFDSVSEIARVPNFMKIRRVGADLSYAKRRTDGHRYVEANSRFFAISLTHTKNNANDQTAQIAA